MYKCAPVASCSDAAFLIAAQAKRHISGFHFFKRFGHMVMVMTNRARPRSRHDFRDDVRGEVFRMLLDHGVQRFDPSRGTVDEYVYGLVLNAIRITERKNRPVIVNRTVQPVGDRTVVHLNDASIVYDNTVRCRPNPAIDTTFIALEQLAIATCGEKPETMAIAEMRFVNDEPLARVAQRFGMNRSAVSRRLNRFCREASARLALSGAA